MPGQGPQMTRPPSQNPPAPAPVRPQSGPSQPPQQSHQNTQNSLNKGVKRPNDDAADSGTDAQPSNMAPQAPTMAPSRSQQGVNLTQEQMSKLTPQQQQQMRANLMRAQDASNKQPRMLSQEEIRAKLSDVELTQKYRLILSQEESKLPKTQPVHISPEARARLSGFIKDKLPLLRKIEQALRIHLIMNEGIENDNTARTAIRARILLLRQLNPQDGTLHQELTMSEDEIKTNIIRILQFVTGIMTRFQKSDNPPQQNHQQLQGSQNQNQSAQPAQLNAANLKLLERERQNKAPPAPTAPQPPFQFGGASPQGAPKYFEGAKPIKNLQLPPDKKRMKVDPASQASASGSKQSPRITSGKDNSPDMKRHKAPEKPAVQKPTFNCKVSHCEHFIRGFDTQAELDLHNSQAHTKIDNPALFALESVAEFVEVDPKTGYPAQASTVASSSKQASAASHPPPPPMKTGQTPSMPPTAATPVGQTAATPMTRVPTQTGIKSSPSTSLLKTPQTTAKGATPSTGVLSKATPASVAKAAPKSPVLPSNQDIQSKVPFVQGSLFDCSYDDIYPLLDANGTFTTLEMKDEDSSWALRSRPSSPLNTPDSSSKDTPSTRQSDISENDNLHINLNLGDVDMPDAWLTALNGDALPLDTQLSEDIQSLGFTLPAMDSDDMMLFYPDNVPVDLDSLDKTMESLGGTLDPSVLGAAA